MHGTITRLLIKTLSKSENVYITYNEPEIRQRPGINFMTAYSKFYSFCLGSSSSFCEHSNEHSDSIKGR